jgi:RHS repeat-associated protein
LGDDLVNHYHSGGNQLKVVNDNPTLTHHECGFADNGSFQNTEYNYYENGNMIADLNKGIDLITYNHLNLPTHIYFANNGTAGRRIGYVYTADGIKLRKYTHLNTNAEGPVSDYVGAFVYENNELQFIQTSEGRLVPNDNGEFNYEYALKDLPIAIGTGNTRVMFSQTGEVLQDQSYYPFGMSMGDALTFNNNTTTPENKYLYNGKELQDDFDLGWYDYGARFYDPQLGRWHVIDPMAEDFYSLSFYNYAYNDPVNFIDPDGRSGVAVRDDENMTVTVKSTFYFYGDGANEEIANSVAASMQQMWNDAGGTMEIDGVEYSVQFEITGQAVTEDKAVELAEENGDNAQNNFIRLEDGSDLSEKSSKMRRGGNSGYFITGEMNNKSTAAHEYGHSLNWFEAGEATQGTHDYSVKDGVPGIMSPRGTPVADEYGYRDQASGRKTVDPNKRKVLPSDINKIAIPKNGRGNVGKADNRILKKNGKVK